MVVKTNDVQGKDEVAHNLGKHSALSDVFSGLQTSIPVCHVVLVVFKYVQ